MGLASNEKEAKKNVIAALDGVAARLGNTRAVCRKYYVHPAIIEAYERGEALPEPPRKKRARRPTAALRSNEIAVLQFLQREIAGDKK
jgi:DNA topoisomerase-1